MESTLDWMGILTQLGNQLIASGLILGVVWSWVKAKGQKIDETHTNVLHLKEQHDVKDGVGNLRWYTDPTINKVLEKLTDIQEKQLVLLQEIKLQNIEIRKTLDKLEDGPNTTIRY